MALEKHLTFIIESIKKDMQERPWDFRYEDASETRCQPFMFRVDPNAPGMVAWYRETDEFYSSDPWEAVTCVQLEIETRHLVQDVLDQIGEED